MRSRLTGIQAETAVVLLELPRLAYLGFAGNPCTMPPTSSTRLQVTSWAEYRVLETLGEGASGSIVRAYWTTAKIDVAIKIYKGELTSDGTPGESCFCFRAQLIMSAADEVSACVLAGSHSNLMYEKAAA